MMNQYGLGTTDPFALFVLELQLMKMCRVLGVTDSQLATIDPYNYMKIHKFEEQNISYLDYIIGTGVGGKGASFSFDESSVKDFDSATKEVYNNKETKVGEMAVVFMQVYAPSTADVFDNYLKTFLTAETLSFGVAPTATLWVNAKLIKGATMFL
jgi:hypothetical protein